jgi:hypothetical protein
MGTRRRRLYALVAAGLVDSLCLSMAWTVVVLEVADRHGLRAVGLLTAAALVGVALSAPVASAAARALDGRRLVRWSAGTEATLRLGVVALLVAEAPVGVLAACALALNVSAWTAYAGMRAEVAAVAAGPSALTWYGTVVAAVEAVGVAVAAILPAVAGTDRPSLMLAVAVVYAGSLLPTVWVAGGSGVPRAVPRAAGRPTRRGWVGGPVASGFLLMLVCSAPTLLSVALALELHGRYAVGLVAVAFTVGSLAAPALAHHVQRWRVDRMVVWSACALGMLVGWLAAPLHVALLCLAQVLAGVSMTALEGLLDEAAARRRPRRMTGALAQAAAARALGSAGGTAAFPFVAQAVGTTTAIALLTVGLVLAVPVGLVLQARHDARHAPRHRAGDVVRGEPVPREASRATVTAAG